MSICSIYWYLLDDSCMFLIIWHIVYIITLYIDGLCVTVIVHIFPIPPSILSNIWHIKSWVFHIVLIFCPEDLLYAKWVTWQDRRQYHWQKIILYSQMALYWLTHVQTNTGLLRNIWSQKIKYLRKTIEENIF